MSTLTVTEERTGNILKIHLQGDLNDAAALAQLELDGIIELRIVCSKLGYINSAGLAAWIFWTRSIESQKPERVFLEDVPPILVRIMTSVRDIIPPRWTMASFSVAYFCEACNKSTTRLVTGVPMLAAHPARAAEMLSHHTCGTCGQKIEIEDSVSRFIDAIKSHS